MTLYIIVTTFHIFNETIYIRYDFIRFTGTTRKEWLTTRTRQAWRSSTPRNFASMTSVVEHWVCKLQCERFGVRSRFSLACCGFVVCTYRIVMNHFVCRVRSHDNLKVYGGSIYSHAIVIGLYYCELFLIETKLEICPSLMVLIVLPLFSLPLLLA